MISTSTSDCDVRHSQPVPKSSRSTIDSIRPTLSDAVSQAIRSVKPLVAERVDVMQSLGRILREDLFSRTPLPPFSKSVVDGYAVRAVDIADSSPGAPTWLTVKGVIPAGSRVKSAIGPAESYRIMTGAPIPEGSDLVIKMEDVAAVRGCIKITRNRFENDHICQQGEDFRAGQHILAGGCPIHPTAMGILSACGRKTVQVSRRPRVGLASTGDELSIPGRNCGAGTIYEVNGHLLSGLIRQAGANPFFLGVRMDCGRALQQLLDQNQGLDMLVITGGGADGDYDLISSVFDKLEIDNILYQYTKTSGCRMFMGERNGQIIFSLPGNPAAAMINFLLFVRPVLDCMMGCQQVGLREGSARVINAWHRKQRRNELYRAKIKGYNDRLRVRLLPQQRYGLLFPLLDMDAIAEIPRITGQLNAGDRVKIYFIDPHRGGWYGC